MLFIHERVSIFDRRCISRILRLCPFVFVSIRNIYQVDFRDDFRHVCQKQTLAWPVGAIEGSYQVAGDFSIRQMGKDTNK